MIRWSKIFWVLLLPVLMLAGACSGQKEDPEQEEWISLFNGKDLDGWEVKFTGHPIGENYKNTFRVEDGVIKAAYDQYERFNGEFGHLFYQEKYSYYRLQLEYRFTGDQLPGGASWATRNNGVMIHAQPASTMGEDQTFPTSIEVQFLGGLGAGERPTGNLCTPGTNVLLGDTLFLPHCINSSSPTYDGNQWVKAEVIVLGDSLITHVINGEPVISYSKPQLDSREPDFEEMKSVYGGLYLKEGHIALQSESHPTEFRNIRLLDLTGCMDPNALNFKSYYVKSDNSRCIYPRKKQSGQ